MSGCGSGLPLREANDACGVANAATRKYLTADHLWYYPPPEAFASLAEYANAHGDKSGRPYFSVDGETPIDVDEWVRYRAKFNCGAGLTNVWRQPHVGGGERVNGTRQTMRWKYRSLHGSQKPLNLIDLTIRVCTDPGDVVWEPFGGLCPAAVCSYKNDRGVPKVQRSSASFTRRLLKGSPMHSIVETEALKDWVHYDLWRGVKKAVLTAPAHFRTITKMEGLQASDIFTLNTTLAAAIEDSFVRTLNSIRAVWDGESRYLEYSFVRQAQTFPDVVLQKIDNGVVPLMGIELKGWYLLAKEKEPTFRFTVTEKACNPWDLLVVVPWVLSSVLSWISRFVQTICSVCPILCQGTQSVLAGANHFPFNCYC